MSKYFIKDLGNGWYDFSQIPQEKSYIKINAVNCGDGRKALLQANHILEVNNLIPTSPNKVEVEIKK